MTDTNQQLMEALDARVERRNDRRDFFKAAIGAAAVAGAGVAAVSLSGVASAQSTNDPSYLNFILNLEYLQAQYYAYATTGTGIASNLTTGTVGPTGTAGAPGTVAGGTQVPFSDPVVAAFAAEFARDQLAHVAYLRSQLGSSAVAMPTIDISGTNANGAFSTIARSANLVAAGAAFNPYANDTNFLLGAFIFEDVVVSAYKGLTPLLVSLNVLQSVCGLLGTQSYHASAIRTTLYAKGLQAQADAISAARLALNVPAGLSGDQGISSGQGIPQIAGASNITPLDSNGLAYSRTTAQVLNILYLTSASSTTTPIIKGGFFPSGVNGPINSTTNVAPTPSPSPTPTPSPTATA